MNDCIATASAERHASTLMPPLRCIWDVGGATACAGLRCRFSSYSWPLQQLQLHENLPLILDLLHLAVARHCINDHIESVAL